jgi:hypothetical protein
VVRGDQGWVEAKLGHRLAGLGLHGADRAAQQAGGLGLGEVFVEPEYDDRALSPRQSAKAWSRVSRYAVRSRRPERAATKSSKPA